MTSFAQKYNDQWDVRGDVEKYVIENLDENGDPQFYSVENGPYGNPVITGEPHKAFDLPDAKYIDAKGDEANPEEKIAGVICKRANEVVHRFSLSSAEAPEFERQEDGSLIIDDTRWRLHSLFSKDKGRYKNYDAFYYEEAPEDDVIQILELQDLYMNRAPFEAANNDVEVEEEAPKIEEPKAANNNVEIDGEPKIEIVPEEQGPKITHLDQPKKKKTLWQKIKAFFKRK